MNVQVKHNGTNITGYVIRYEREHKICTGIGNLTVEIDRTIPRTFDPWDTIDIYENSSFKVRYYISNSTDSIPKGTITLDCQDVSKRLVDYFIPTSYTIDYPSYTRYWIEKFLTEAGVAYTFTTSSQGNLISNNTQLGLVSAYEQLLTLLQMSGWFIYFNQSERAVIGSLDADLAVGSRSIGKTDILNINRISDDKMLRNRALVLGAFDAYSLKYATADVTVHTPWNYDSRDVRAVVISNSNIPNKNSAYGIANQLIKEFARITVEKHITVWGARDYNLGQALRVNSNVWRGKGMITTFGTSMSKEGLVTNIVLDERCPRLFGFFDYGDYVYVGTYGDGIWKKHIKFDPNWYDFSTGLTNLEITDLHINNGIFGSVGSSGQLYRAFEDSSWSVVQLSGLLSSAEDTIVSGGAVNYVPFSGLMGRAVIVDKVSSTLKFGIDNASGMNMGDYFLDYYPSGNIIGSGVAASGNFRSWIIEYDPFTGNPVGGIGSGIYPISVSGNYNLTLIDLENDGINDYVSVRTSSGISVPYFNGAYDFGFQNTQPFASTKDNSNYSIMPQSEDYIIDNDIVGSASLNTFNRHSFVSIDNLSANLRKVMALGKDRKGRVVTFSRDYDSFLGQYVINSSTITSAIASPVDSLDIVLGIYPDWYLNKFTVFYRTDNALASHDIKYTIWDANADTWDAAVTMATQSLDAPNGISATLSDSVTIDNIIYNERHYVSAPGTSGGFYRSASEFHIYLDVIDMQLKSYEQRHLLEVITTEYATNKFETFVTSSLGGSEGLGVLLHQNVSIFQNNNTIQLLGWIVLGHHDAGAPPDRFREYVIKGTATTVNVDLVYDDSTFRWNNGSTNRGSQLTIDKAFIGKHSTVVGEYCFTYNGTTYQLYTSGGALPYYEKYSTIFPILGTGNEYLAYNASDNKYHVCSATTILPTGTAEIDDDHQLFVPYSSPLRIFGDEVYITIRNYIDGGRFEQVPYRPASNTFDYTRRFYHSNMLTGGSRRINYGDLFIAEPADYSVSIPLTQVRYVDMGNPDYGGGSYMVLQREGVDFNIIQTASYPIRLDISNNSPVLTVGSGENSFVSNFVYSSTLEQVIFASGHLRTVDDYRYTYLEPSVSGVVTSGEALQSSILYITGSGIFGTDTMTYSGGFSVIYDVPSGYGNRIETSNFGLGGQYVFITTSGDFPNFYQADPGSHAFISYSGLPQSRATIIRLDDRM